MWCLSMQWRSLSLSREARTHLIDSDKGIRTPPSVVREFGGMSRRLTAEKVGQKFITKYYSTPSDDLYKFYKEESSFSYGEGCSVERPVTGVEGIRAKLAELGLGDARFDVDSAGSIDFQSSKDGSVMLLVTGMMTRKGASPRQFVQSFLLARQETDEANPHYFVLNDIVRIVGTVPQSVPIAAVAVGGAVPEEETVAHRPHQHAQQHQRQQHDAAELSMECAAVELQPADRAVEAPPETETPADEETYTTPPAVIPPPQEREDEPETSYVGMSSVAAGPELDSEEAAGVDEEQGESAKPRSWVSIVGGASDAAARPGGPESQTSNATGSRSKRSSPPKASRRGVAPQGGPETAGAVPAINGNRSAGRPALGEEENPRSIFIKAVDNSEISEEDIRGVVEGCCGVVRKVHPKGHFAFVDFVDVESADRVLDAFKLDQSALRFSDGRKVTMARKRDKAPGRTPERPSRTGSGERRRSSSGGHAEGRPPRRERASRGDAAEPRSDRAVGRQAPFLGPLQRGAFRRDGREA